MGNQPAKIDLPILNSGRLKENALKLCRRMLRNQLGFIAPNQTSVLQIVLMTRNRICGMFDISVYLVVELKQTNRSIAN